MRPNRVPVWFLAAKICVAAALLASLTLPFATCYSKGQTIDVSSRTGDWSSVASTCFTFGWPLPLIALQIVALARGRRYRTILAAECLGALYSWWQLTIEVVALGVLTFGSATYGPGYVLATDCDAGYFALAVLELIYSAVISRAPSSRTRIVTST